MEELRLEDFFLDFCGLVLLCLFISSPTLRLISLFDFDARVLVFILMILLLGSSIYRYFLMLCCKIEVHQINKDIEDYNIVKHALIKNVNEYNKLVENIKTMRVEYDTKYAGKHDDESFDKLCELAGSITSVSECHGILEQAMAELNKARDDILERISDIEYRYGDEVNIEKVYDNK